MATADRVDAIRELLVRAEEAHGTYEATELNGVYDEDWPRWYAGYAVDNDIAALLGRDVTTEELAVFLATSYAEFERLDPKPGESWALHIARRIVTEL